MQRQWRTNGKTGKLHRDDDLPAIIKVNGDKYYCINGQYHRDYDKPAVEFISVNKIWYNNGLYHRDGDNPALIINKTEDCKQHY